MFAFMTDPFNIKQERPFILKDCLEVFGILLDGLFFFPFDLPGPSMLSVMGMNGVFVHRRPASAVCLTTPWHIVTCKDAALCRHA